MKINLLKNGRQLLTTNNYIIKNTSYKSSTLRLSKLNSQISLKSSFSTTKFNMANSQQQGPTLSQVTEHKEAEIIQRKQLTARTLILNRPKALNALTLSMAWDQSDLCKVIVMKSEHEKAFCAGGDVKAIAELGKSKSPEASNFFEEEYQLNHLISSLKTPLVVFIDGITMGGGVGLSVHAPFRVATEKTVFAMPETSIGLFPDVGGSFFLPRLDGELGTYLGLTGHRLKGKDVFLAGIATHYVPSQRLQAIEERLGELDSKDFDVVNLAIEDFVAEPDNIPFSLDIYRDAINRCFKFDSVVQITDALEKEVNNQNNSEEIRKWAQTTLTTLEASSPTSLIVTLEQLRRGRKLSIDRCFQMEFNLGSKFLFDHDFVEGVEAKLVRKSTDRPNWVPNTLSQADPKSIIQHYFSQADVKELQLLPQAKDNTQNKQLTKYLHNYGLPSATELHGYLNSSAITTVPTVDDLVEYFLLSKDHKVGTKAKVLALIDTYCTVNQNTFEVQWKH